MSASLFCGAFSRLFVLVGLVALAVPSRAGETVLVGANSVWKYRSAATSPGEGWMKPGFNAEEWPSGPAKLGYGDGNEATLIDGPRTIAVYFRRSFVVEAPDRFSALVIRLLRDDGAVVYLNGEIVARSNLPEGPITPATLAIETVGGEGESMFHRFEAPPGRLVAGENVIAVEVHQVNPSSSDLGFALELIGLSDTTAPALPVVSIEATRAETAEPMPEARIAPGEFTLRRTGSTDKPLTVFLNIGGTATPEADYHVITSPIEFPIGASELTRFVVARDDERVEGLETVVAELVEPPTAGPMATYQIAPDRAKAVVTIHDADRPDEATVVITQPTSGDVVKVGATILVKATAIDPSGYIPLVEFYDRDTRIGVSRIDFVILPAPGTRIDHAIEWKVSAPGERVLRARGTSSTGAVVWSEPVVIVASREDEPVEQVILSLETVDASAAEPTSAGEANAGVFAVKRVGGPSHVPVMAFYLVQGTASNGVDYKELPREVMLEAGQMAAEIRVVPLGDDRSEGEETVVLTLIPPVCPAIFPPPPGCYLIQPPDEGTVVIRDGTTSENLPPLAHIGKPMNGAVFTLGTEIEVVAEASDRDGSIERLDILADGELLASSKENRLVARWTAAPLGEHVLLARAVDDDGAEGRSEPVKILVRRADDAAFVFRHLPSAYTPGTPFRVELKAEPPSSARAYAVEDRPPGEWAVSEISHEGKFDPATRKVKFGPFTDSEARTLSYQLTPPTGASGRKEFGGAASIDGVSYPIGGDRLIESGASAVHPADRDGNSAIGIDELTAYSAAWKGGMEWSVGPNPIPLSFVTRAGMIWKNGERYAFESGKVPPLCWSPLAPDGLKTLAGEGEPFAGRDGNGELKPGAPVDLQIEIKPPAGVTAYTVEERIPRGWSVSNVSAEGWFDANSGMVRWGIFFDANPRTLHYTVTAPEDVTAIGRLSGIVSFDGLVREIHGRSTVVSVEPGSRPLLEKCERDGEGRIRLRLSGPPGQVGILQRSGDLEIWEDVTTLFLPDGTVEFTDEAAANAVQYYRLQVR